MGYEFYVSVKGQKQGAFKGEGTRENIKDKIVAVSFGYDLKSPRDPATGHASGKRQHSPVRIVKKWGAATPQFFQALVSNEVLPEVKLEFHRANANGEEYVYYRITLTNASVSSIRQFTSDGVAGADASSSKHAASADIKEMEEISFTFGKIEIESTDGKTMGMDDWRAND